MSSDEDRGNAHAFPIAVLISGAGTNLQALIDSVAAPVSIAGVASSRADAPGLGRAARAGIEQRIFAAADYPNRQARDTALGDWLEQLDVRLVVLAGWMELLGPDFIRRFAGGVINVHPSLLPAFPGTCSIEDAVGHGVKVTGVTVHFVDEEVDSGAIILQESVELSYPAAIAAIEERVHGVEHRLLPRAVRLIAEGRVRLDSANPRVVLIDDVD